MPIKAIKLAVPETAKENTLGWILGRFFPETVGKEMHVAGEFERFFSDEEVPYYRIGKLPNSSTRAGIGTVPDATHVWHSFRLDVANGRQHAVQFIQTLRKFPDALPGVVEAVYERPLDSAKYPQELYAANVMIPLGEARKVLTYRVVQLPDGSLETQRSSFRVYIPKYGGPNKLSAPLLNSFAKLTPDYWLYDVEAAEKNAGPRGHHWMLGDAGYGRLPESLRDELRPMASAHMLGMRQWDPLEQWPVEIRNQVRYE